jgi:sec-independent protein translocase protein TatA
MEIILVLVIALLIFGPNRLPQAGRSLGRAVREFRRATDSARSELGLDQVIDEFKGVRDDISGEFNGVKDSVDSELKSSGAKEAMSAIKTGMSIDLKNPLSVAKTVIGGGVATLGAATVDKPVQVAPAVDEDDDAWPQGANLALDDAVLNEMLGQKPPGNGSTAPAAGEGAVPRPPASSPDLSPASRDA